MRAPALSPVDEDGEADVAASFRLGDVVGAAVITAGVVGFVLTAPHVKRGWIERALPRLKGRWARRREPTKSEDGREGTATVIEVSINSQPVVEEFANAVEVVLDDERETMTSDEAAKRLAGILVAAAFIAEQMRVLSSVRLQDDPAFPELQKAMERLTAQQVTDGINRMLDADPTLLDEQTSNQLLRAFGSGGVVEGQLVPLDRAKVRAALNLGT